jgi:nucleoside-diphosphate-sugar epimerase
VSDVARLYRLALEQAQPGSRYHAVAEEGIAMRDIAHTVGRRLGLPVRSITAQEAPEHFGSFARFLTLDAPASSEQTRRKLGWQPDGPGLIGDLEQLALTGG